jgi:putative endonuclease
MSVYILLCADNSFYTGVTNNLEARLEQHYSGINKNCYTFTRRPLQLVFYEIFPSAESAIAFEKKVKGWSRAKKIAIIEGRWLDLKKLSECKNESNHVISMLALRLRSG